MKNKILILAFFVILNFAFSQTNKESIKATLTIPYEMEIFYDPDAFFRIIKEILQMPTYEYPIPKNFKKIDIREKHYKGDHRYKFAREVLKYPHLKAKYFSEERKKGHTDQKAKVIAYAKYDLNYPYEKALYFTSGIVAGIFSSINTMEKARRYAYARYDLGYKHAAAAVKYARETN